MDAGLGGAPPELVRLFHAVNAQKDRQMRELVSKCEALDRELRARDQTSLVEVNDLVQKNARLFRRADELKSDCRSLATDNHELRAQLARQATELRAAKVLMGQLKQTLASRQHAQPPPQLQPPSSPPSSPGSEAEAPPQPSPARAAEAAAQDRSSLPLAASAPSLIRPFYEVERPRHVFTRHKPSRLSRPLGSVDEELEPVLESPLVGARARRRVGRLPASANGSSPSVSVSEASDHDGRSPEQAARTPAVDESIDNEWSAPRSTGSHPPAPPTPDSSGSTPSPTPTIAAVRPKRSSAARCCLKEPSLAAKMRQGGPSASVGSSASQGSTVQTPHQLPMRAQASSDLAKLDAKMRGLRMADLNTQQQEAVRRRSSVGMATPRAESLAAARPRRASTPRAAFLEPSLKAKLRQGDENTFGSLWHSAAAGTWYG